MLEIAFGCVYVCMHMYMHIYIYIYMNIYMYRIFKHIDIYVSMRACVQQYIYIRICVWLMGGEHKSEKHRMNLSGS